MAYLQPITQPPFYGIHKNIRITAICGGIAVDGRIEPKNPMSWADFAEKYGAGSSLTGVFH